MGVAEWERVKPADGGLLKTSGTAVGEAVAGDPVASD